MTSCDVSYMGWLIANVVILSVAPLNLVSWVLSNRHTILTFQVVIDF